MINISRRALSLAALCLAMNMGNVFAADNPKVQFKTSQGEFVVELYPEMAPKTVENFIRYVKAGHYSGTIFHRVINDFMIQGGGFDKNMREKPTLKPIPLEAAYALEKGLKNDIGTIAMARTDVPDSATSQFFINVTNNNGLNHQPLPDGDPVQFTYRGETVTAPRADALLATAGYTPFGRVIKGMDVVERIKAVPTKNTAMMQDVPVTPVIIESAKLIK